LRRIPHSRPDTTSQHHRADFPGLPLGYEHTEFRQPIGFTAPSPGPRTRGTSHDGLICETNAWSHALAVAPTGAGKGVNVLIPWSLSYLGSMVFFDPKAEVLAVCARFRSLHGQMVSAFAPWLTDLSAISAYCKLQTFNPMQVMLTGSENLEDDCLTLVEAVAGEASARSSQDPFWRAIALDLLAALVGWVWIRSVVTGKTLPDDRTFAGVWNLLHEPDLTYTMAVILDVHEKHPSMPRFVRDGVVQFLDHEGEKVRTSCVSEACSLIRIFASPLVQAATATTDIDYIARLQRGELGSTFFIVVPPDKLQSHAGLVRIVLGTMLTVMLRRKCRPAVPTLFCVDECGHIGPIPALKQAITLSRGYGVRVALFLQSLYQLESLWPADHRTILENCGLWLNFGNTTRKGAQRVAEELGDVSADQLFAMTPDQLAIHRSGEPTIIARRLNYLTQSQFAGRFAPNPYYANAAEAASRNRRGHRRTP
jgi:type IV secretion system protein VirD4